MLTLFYRIGLTSMMYKNALLKEFFRYKRKILAKVAEPIILGSPRENWLRLSSSGSLPIGS